MRDIGFFGKSQMEILFFILVFLFIIIYLLGYVDLRRDASTWCWCLTREDIREVNLCDEDA